MLVFYYNKTLKYIYMSNKDFNDKCNPLSRKDISLRNLKAATATEKCLRYIEISLGTFLETAISKVLDTKKIRNDNQSKLAGLRSLIENLISSLHQHLSSYDYGFDKKFKLYIQQFDENNNTIYDIGYGSSKDSSNSAGNLPDLSPYKFNYEVVNGVSSCLFSFPGISILYDIANISLSIKVWDVDNNDNLENTNKNKELILNIIPEIAESSWKVYNVFSNLANYQLNVFQFEANALNGFYAAPAGTGTFNIIAYPYQILNNLGVININNILTVSYPDDADTPDTQVELIGHVNGFGPGSAKVNDDLELYPVTFYFKGAIDTTKAMNFKINVWDLDSNNSKNYYNIQKELFENSELLEFLDFIDNRYNTVQSVKKNILSRGIF